MERNIAQSGDESRWSHHLVSEQAGSLYRTYQKLRPISFLADFSRGSLVVFDDRGRKIPDHPRVCHLETGPNCDPM